MSGLFRSGVWTGASTRFSDMCLLLGFDTMHRRFTVNQVTVLKEVLQLFGMVDDAELEDDLADTNAPSSQKQPGPPGPARRCDVPTHFRSLATTPCFFMVVVSWFTRHICHSEALLVYITFVSVGARGRQPHSQRKSPPLNRSQRPVGLVGRIAAPWVLLALPSTHQQGCSLGGC